MRDVWFAWRDRKLSDLEKVRRARTAVRQVVEDMQDEPADAFVHAALSACEALDPILGELEAKEAEKERNENNSTLR